MAVVVAMTIVAMVGMVGLAIDLGQMFVSRTEAQNGADACALAAVADLHDGTANPTELAEAAGRTVAALHKVGLQTHALTGTATPVTITFSQAAAGPFVSGAGLTGPQATAMKYVRCEVTYSGIKPIFLKVLNSLPGVNIGDQSVKAIAVATLLPSQGSCAIPIALCTADAVPSNVGKWFPGPLQPGPDAELISGNFGWVDLTPGGKGTADIGSQIKSSGVCELPEIGTPVAVAGNRTALAAQFNSRFGIYFGAVSPGDSPPDRSGYAYTKLTWSSMQDAFPNFPARRTANDPYQGNTAAGLTAQGGDDPKLKPYLEEYGQDRRVVVVPVVDCTSEGKAVQNATITGWGCVFLLHPMNPTAPDTSGTTGGTGGGTGGGGTGGGGKGGGGTGGGGTGGSGTGGGGTGGGGTGGATTGGGTTGGTSGGTSSSLQCFDGANSSKVCVEYLGAANAENSPCLATGMPGAPISPGPRVPALVR